jgi:hypothetical protein
MLTAKRYRPFPITRLSRNRRIRRAISFHTEAR